MATVNNFKDLIAWQKARELNRRVYQVTRHPPLSRDFGLVTQMQRASVSVIANIAEGYERDTLGEFHRFLTISRASCAELQSHLVVAIDAGYISDMTFESMTNQAEEVSRILSGLRTSVARRNRQQQHRNRTETTQH